ncbi:MAG: ATP-dependent 6-phosphofructokinase [Rickettsiales bacterium]|nr:ATP-dependent 6-phosphofructokinase [Rickettsiales bacterium]|tara:strand:+ start:709 stop:1674 length:966 start_codon:yes stop_codon:yes gene_type:complete
MRKIAVLTSGGDAPGMNAAIRAIVRTSLNKGTGIIGFKNGYEGIIDNDYVYFDKRSVGNIIQRGGSILHTSRSSRFLKKKYRQVAENNLRALGIDGLIVIGGEGSTKGAFELSKISKTKCIVVPATIDKDMALVGSTIGFDTAINTALAAIDKIRDTATTANVTHIVEVMGRNCGWLGILAGIGAGAEVTIIPEVKINIAKLAQKIKYQLNEGKKGCIIILAEGGFSKGGTSLANALKEEGNLDLRITTLGHMQRGGNPSAVDRVLATELGVNAVLSLKDGFSSVIIAKPVDTIEKVDFDKVVNAQVNVDMYLHNLIEDTA